MKKNSLKLSLLAALHFSLLTSSEGGNTKLSQVTEWEIVSLLRDKSTTAEIHGNPTPVDSPYGPAVHFDGVSDAFFLKNMPLESLREFTVEMIFCPDTDSPFEQRILHIGEVSEDRMLLEIRAVDGNWYFDGFIASGPNKKALIDPKLTHALGQWHHVALVVGPESMSTFVNGKKELSAPLSFSPIESGRTSIGVRQNIRSWYQGKIYKIRITPRQLKPDEFMAPKLISEIKIQKP